MIANNLSILENAVPPEQSIYIEGVPVDRLFDLLSANMADEAHQCNKRINFELIAWEPLIAAADWSLLVQTLQDILDYALTQCKNEKISMEAYPSDDGVYVTLSCHFERTAHSLDDFERFSSHKSASWRRTIEKMSGAYHHHHSQNGDECINIRLVHWLVEHDFDSRCMVAA